MVPHRADLTPARGQALRRPLLFTLLLCVSHLTAVSLGAPLSTDFYARSCPAAQAIVAESVKAAIAADVSLAAQLLRLAFHDCFGRGCDASILIQSTGGLNRVEQDAVPNFTLGGFAVVGKAKARLEATCPGTVSCADVLMLAARESVQLLGGPFIPLRLGRRDALTSKVALAQGLPEATYNLSQVLRTFTHVGLDLVDVVALSGSHTIGKALCARVHNRLSPPDPTMNGPFRRDLRARCGGKQFNENRFILMDAATPKAFDNQYYVDLLARKGLFTADQAVNLDPRTRPLVRKYAGDQAAFFAQYSASLLKMSEIRVLTGEKGEIRKDCRVQNGKPAPRQ